MSQYETPVFVIFGTRVDGGERECLGWYEYFNPANNYVNQLNQFGRYNNVTIEEMTLRQLGLQLGQYEEGGQ